MSLEFFLLRFLHQNASNENTLSSNLFVCKSSSQKWFKYFIFNRHNFTRTACINLHHICCSLFNMNTVITGLSMLKANFSLQSVRHMMHQERSYQGITVIVMSLECICFCSYSRSECTKSCSPTFLTFTIIDGGKAATEARLDIKKTSAALNLACQLDSWRGFSFETVHLF